MNWRESMAYLLSLIFVAVGLGLYFGNRVVCYVLVPEVWFWKTIAGVTPGPTYRRTQGVIFMLIGLAIGLAGPIARVYLS